MFYTVWVGGTEVNDVFLDNLEDASLLAKLYIDKGYDDVYVAREPQEK